MIFNIHFSADAGFIQLLTAVIDRSNTIMATLDEVLAKVTAQGTELDGVRTLIAGLRQQVKDALAATGKLSPADQAKVDAIFSAAESNSAEIVEAIAENVPTPTPPVATI